MKFVRYVKSLIATDTGNSSKSFTLIMSSIVSFITGLVISFSIVYDVVTNGYIKTDLEQVGIFMLCVGGFMVGSGVPKIFGDKYEEKSNKSNENEEEEINDP